MPIAKIAHLAREMQRGVAVLVGRLGGRSVVEEVADAGTVPPAGGPDERGVAIVVNGLDGKKQFTNTGSRNGLMKHLNQGCHQQFYRAIETRVAFGTYRGQQKADQRTSRTVTAS